MVSAAEQFASNLNFGAFAKAGDLKKRIWFTLGALIVYRLGTYIPLPGINPQVLQDVFSQSGGLLDVFNVLSGGAFGRMTIFALTIMPYISASIIIQLMTAVSPTLDQLKKEGEAGRKKINQYTRYLTVLLAAVQAYGISVGLQSLTGEVGSQAVLQEGFFFRISTVVILVGGTIFLMWLGEQITARGVGNGISLIIFIGIVAEMPRALSQLFQLGRTDQISTFALLAVLLGAVAIIAFVVFMERAQRRIVVQYPKRQMGNKVFAGDQTHLPLKLNTAGVIPPIFASSLLLMPATLLSFSSTPGGMLERIATWLGHGQPLYIALFAFLIIFFAFFYTAIVFNPQDTAENLRKHGGFVPGIRPGKNTADYLDFVLTRLTVVGALYLAFVCVLPEFLMARTGTNTFFFGGTSLLIMVTVTLDTVTQIQSHLMAHQYESLMKKARPSSKTRRVRRR